MASSTVGGLTLPIAAGAANSAIGDATLTGLLAYLSFCLRTDLDAKLAAMAGMSSSAAPTANTYPWDPSTHFVRGPEGNAATPALYLWWPGVSTHYRLTTILNVRKRALKGMWLFDEHVMPNGLRSRTGLLGAVDASLAKAADRGRHPSHTPTGYAPGFEVRSALSLRDWTYDGAVMGEMAAEIPATSKAAGGPPEGHIKRGYPALSFGMTVLEVLNPDTLLDPTDLADFDITIYSNESGDTVDHLEILNRYENSPDGSEQG